MSRTRNLVLGAVAGAVGTAAMDLLWYRRYRQGGGAQPALDWEFSDGLDSWKDAPAPAQIGHKVERAVLRRDPPDDWARTTTNVVHWATGIGWGMQYGALAAKTTRHPWAGMLVLGPAAFFASYVLLPPLKVYKPIWEYDAETLGKDFSAHLLYGFVAGVAFAALTGSRGRRSPTAAQCATGRRGSASPLLRRARRAPRASVL